MKQKKQIVHPIKVTCYDADAADLIGIEVRGVKGQSERAIHKQRRGNRTLEEAVLKEAVLDGIKKANLKEGAFVSLTFRIDSTNPKQPLFGLNTGILGVACYAG